MILGCTLHQTSKLVTQNDLAILNYPKSRGKYRTAGCCAPFIRHSVDGQRSQKRSFPEATRLYQEHL